jgi:hypothetical protein
VHYTATDGDKMDLHSYICIISSKLIRLTQTVLHYEKQINRFHFIDHYGRQPFIVFYLKK